MTPDEINEAIAKHCGWEARHREDLCDGVNIIRCAACGMEGHANCFGGGDRPIQTTCRKRGGCCEEAIPPNYHGDLNAMHKAENAADFHSYPLREKYLYILMDVVKRGDNHRLVVSATAAQRAEAFLRTIGRWKTQSD